VGPRDGLDDVEKRKFLTLPGLELDPSVVQPVASRYTDYAIAVPLVHGVLIKQIFRTQNQTQHKFNLRQNKIIYIRYRLSSQHD
jgi:hypothetical protein